MNFHNLLNKYIAQKDFQINHIGKSGAGVYMFDNMVLKIQPISTDSENEMKMMQWLQGKITIPDIIEQINDNGYSYLLMSKCEGQMSCAEEFMTNPNRLVEQLAGAMYQLWSIPVENCPCRWPLKKRLQQAAEHVSNGNVNIDDAQPDTFSNNGFKDPEHLLQWLMDNQPEETAVVTHGDFCLPNIFLNDAGLTGLIDLGKAGAADRWQDIALCLRSLSNNYSGVYGGKKYSGFKDHMLFDALQIKPEPDLIRYYILLDELF